MLNKTQLENDLKNLAKDMREFTDGESDSVWAERMASIVESYVKSGDIRITGIVTAGSPTTQTQTVPITVKIT